MSSETNKAIVRRYMEEAWNDGHIEVLDECCSPACFSGGAITLGDVKAYIQRFRSIIPGKMTILEMIAEDDKVVTHWTWTGTNTGPVYNPTLDGWGPPTGKPFCYTGITIHQVVNGKVASETWLDNWTDTLIKMGVTPAVTPETPLTHSH